MRRIGNGELADRAVDLGERLGCDTIPEVVFFSSRRRHTRLVSDWSSDVCSSDLRGAVEADGGRRYVFVVKKNQLGVGKSTLEKREIHVGIADATNYEVVSGLQEGELVALPGEIGRASCRERV